MAQQEGTLAAPPEDLILVLSTHAVAFTGTQHAHGGDTHM